MADGPSIAESKRALRASMTASLAGVDSHARHGASRAACARLLELDEIRDAAIVLFYMAMRTEIDPGGAALVCLEDGVRVAVPVVDEASGELEAVEISSLAASAFERGPMGILVPKGGRRVRATELDAAVVPGLAFDREGHRLGRGGGHYDRLLVRLTERCCAVGFAFERQVLGSLPVEPHDRRVAKVVTEATVYG